MALGAISRLVLAGSLPSLGVLAQPLAAPTQTRIMVGAESSVIIEDYQPAWPARETTFVLQLPAGVDPSTLVVMDPAGRAMIQQLRIRAPVADTQAVARVEWSAPVALKDAEIPRTVEIVVRSTDSRPRPLEALFTTDRMSWRARYDVTVRGDVANHLEPLSVDLEGRYYISNGLSRTFQSARVVLRGPDTVSAESATIRKPRGFLMLDEESPLADLWRVRPPPVRPPQLYAVPGKATLLGGQVTAIRFAFARRMAADRVYVMDSDDIPLSASADPRPLRQRLSWRNERKAGLGIPLPPGVATVVAGAGRSSIRQDAQLYHTPAGGRLRLDLGPSSAVLGARRSAGRSVAKSGFTEETVELRIINQLPSAVRVEVVERPPVPLAWDVVRSSRPYEIIARRLHMELNIPARSEERITYTVRLTEPEG